MPTFVDASPESTRYVLACPMQTADRLPISENEFRQVQNAKAVLLASMFLEEKFDLVAENYLEFESTSADLSIAHMVRRSITQDGMHDARLTMNRRLINLLSACRGYIDFSRPFLRRNTFPSIVDSDAFEREFTARYDSSFAYRVMEEMRNFAQHRGFPIHVIEFTSERAKIGGADALNHSMSLYTKTKYLAMGNAFKRGILEELESHGGRINVVPLTREYVGHLGDIHWSLRKCIDGGIEAAESDLASAAAQFREAFPVSPAADVLAAVEVQDGLHEQMTLRDGPAERRKELIKRTQPFTGLARRFISGFAAPID